MINKQMQCLENKVLMERRLVRLKKLRDDINKGTLPQLIIFGDKHGDAEDLERIADQARNFVRNHHDLGKKLTIIGHGDGFDRGNQNVEVFELLRELKAIEKENPGQVEVRLLWGNHDVMLMQYNLLQDQEALGDWLSEGGLQTYKDFRGAEIEGKDVALFMLENFELFYIDEWGMFHVHAGIPMDKDGVPSISNARMVERQNQLNSFKDKLKTDRKEFLENQELLKEVKEFFEQKDLLWLLWAQPEHWLDHVADPDNKEIIIDEQNEEKSFTILKKWLRKYRPNLSDDELSSQVNAQWKDILLTREDVVKRCGVDFQVITKEKKINRAVLDNFLMRLSVNGVFFGHIHELVNVENKIVGIDVDDQDPGHFMLDESGLSFNSLSRRRNEQIVSMDCFLNSITEEINVLKEQLRLP